jgi:hypothetical protein
MFNFVTCMGGYLRSFALDTGFIDHLNTRLVTTLSVLSTYFPYRLWSVSGVEVIVYEEVL